MWINKIEVNHFVEKELPYLPFYHLEVIDFKQVSSILTVMVVYKLSYINKSVLYTNWFKYTDTTTIKFFYKENA